jgi:hypothetical protein
MDDQAFDELKMRMTILRQQPDGLQAPIVQQSLTSPGTKYRSGQSPKPKPTAEHTIRDGPV